MFKGSGLYMLLKTPVSNVLLKIICQPLRPEINTCDMHNLNKKDRLKQQTNKQTKRLNRVPSGSESVSDQHIFLDLFHQT